MTSCCYVGLVIVTLASLLQGVDKHHWHTCWIWKNRLEFNYARELARAQVMMERVQDGRT
jgi:hypothetical protein